MKEMKKRILIYIGAGNVIVFSAALLEFWFDGIFIITLALAMSAMLFDIGRSIEGKRAKKKYFTYVGIFVGQIIFTLFVSAITGVATSNTWLGFVYGNAFALTIIVMSIDIIKSLKGTQGFITFCLKLLILMFAIILVISNIAFLMGV